ncbi:hypothetical protein KUCAC02_000476, partial [Chaenocephalus aceratus]
APFINLSGPCACQCRPTITLHQEETPSSAKLTPKLAWCTVAERRNPNGFGRGESRYLILSSSLCSGTELHRRQSYDTSRYIK